MTSITEINEEIFDEHWEYMEDMKSYGPTSRHQRRLILNLLRPLQFDSVLDIGCGAGHLLNEIKQNHPSVKQLAGTDLVPKAIELSKARVPEGTFTKMDTTLEHLPYTFDLTTAVDVLEHVEDDEAMLRNIRAMTSKYFLAMTIQGDVMPEWEREAVGHIRNYKRGELQTKITNAGFKIDKVVEWGFPFYSPLYRWIQAQNAAGGTTGSYGASRKMIAQAIYTLFWLNSSRRGDVILVLASVDDH